MSQPLPTSPAKRHRLIFDDDDELPRHRVRPSLRSGREVKRGRRGSINKDEVDELTNDLEQILSIKRYERLRRPVPPTQVPVDQPLPTWEEIRRQLQFTYHS
jgi:hypothetical protein